MESFCFQDYLVNAPESDCESCCYVFTCALIIANYYPAHHYHSPVYPGCFGEAAPVSAFAANFCLKKEIFGVHRQASSFQCV